MKPVILDWGWMYDILQCPDYIADNINSYQMQFDKWLYDKTNDHGYWVAYPPYGSVGFPDPYGPRDPNGQDGISWGVDALIDWLNRFAVRVDQKVSLIEFQLDDRLRIDEMVDAGVIRIFG